MINHVGNVEVPTVEMAARPPFTLGRVGAGTASKARRDRALVPLAFVPPVSCFATPAGKVTASDGRPGLGVCPPPAAGIVSQYWFSALSAEPVQPGALAAPADSGASALITRTTTAMRRNLGMSDLIRERCYPIKQS